MRVISGNRTLAPAFFAMSDTAAKPEKARNREIWNYRGPVIFSALFKWPPDPAAAIAVIGKRWVTLSRNTLFLLFAVITYRYLLPELSTMQSLSLDWILPVFLRNMLLLILVAGGLHLYLYLLELGQWRYNMERL